MCPLNDYYDEIDDIGYDGVEAIRHLIDDMQRQDQQIASRKRHRYARKDSWRDENFGRYADFDENSYDDYDEDEFDQSSGIDLGHY